MSMGVSHVGSLPPVNSLVGSLSAVSSSQPFAMEAGHYFLFCASSNSSTLCVELFWWDFGTNAGGSNTDSSTEEDKIYLFEW